MLNIGLGRTGLGSALAPVKGGGALILSPSGSLDVWKAARAEVLAGTSRAVIACVGDSTTAGVGATDGTGRRKGSYAAKLAAALVGHGIASPFDSVVGNQFVSTANASVFDPRITLGSGWANDTLETAGAQSWKNTTTTGAISFVPDGDVDTFEVWSFRNTGLGTWSWNVDGGADTNVVEAGTPEAYFKTTISAGALGAHTLNLKRVSGSCYIAAIVAYDSAAKAVDVLNMGRGSGTTTTINDATRAWSPVNSIPLFGADLTLISLGINDYTPATLVDLATYTSNLQALETAFAATGDVAYVVPPQSAVSRQTAEIQETYRNAMRSLAQTNGRTVFDLARKWGSYDAAVAAGFMNGGADLVHPNAAGYIDWGTWIGDYLATV